MILFLSYFICILSVMHYVILKLERIFNPRQKNLETLWKILLPLPPPRSILQWISSHVTLQSHLNIAEEK